MSITTETIVTRIFSLLPVSALEWLLTAFAWLQLYILAAKGAQSKLDRVESQERKRRKIKKKTGRRRKSVVSVGGLHHHASTSDQEQSNNLPDTSPPPLAPTPPLISPTAGAMPQSEVDVLGDNILFESNEQHRREFEDFLRSVKDIKDVHNWLKNFSNEAPRKIAIVKLSRRILETDYGTTQAAAALSFMFKFGLFPIVVHGGWNELARDTCSEVLARRKSFSHRLKAEIRRCGVGAAILTPDVCEVESVVRPPDAPFQDEINFSGGFVSAVGEGRRGSLHMEGGLSFEVKSIDHSRLCAYLEKGKIPIWDGVAITSEGAEVPLNGDVTTVELAHLLQPFRIIFACNDGGILDKDNKAIPVVYMDKDYEELMQANWVTQRRKIQLLQLRRIVSVVPSSCTVVVTAIDAITHQLMYPRLANETIVKRAEENVVHVIEDINQVDKEQLKNLIEDSFGRPLAPDYLDNLQDNLYRLYLITGMDGEYNGCAVITHGVKWEGGTASDSDSDHHNDSDTPSSSSSRHAPLSRQQSSTHLPPTTTNTLTREPSSSNIPLNTLSCQPTSTNIPLNAGMARQPSSKTLTRQQSSSQISYSHASHSSSHNGAVECSDNTSVGTDDESYKFYYLCKFCVRKAAQGLGLGDLLWRSLQRDIERLYWRSRTNNPLNAWYYARCQGSFRTNAHFTVFWYGDDRFEDGASLITDALSKPITILPVPRDT